MALVALALAEAVFGMVAFFVAAAAVFFTVVFALVAVRFAEVFALAAGVDFLAVEDFFFAAGMNCVLREKFSFHNDDCTRHGFRFSHASSS